MNLIAIEQLHRQKLVAAARDMFRELFAPQSAAPADVMTIAETAKRLSVSPAKVRDWIKSGRLAAIKTGRSHRVTLAAIQAMQTKAAPFTPRVPRHY